MKNDITKGLSLVLNGANMIFFVEKADKEMFCDLPLEVKLLIFTGYQKLCDGLTLITPPILENFVALKDVSDDDKKEAILFLKEQKTKQKKEMSLDIKEKCGIKTFYISGPMTGFPELNFPAFFKEETRLRALGFDVVNPATLNPDTETPWQICMKNDIKALVDCDALITLEGWEKSKGAVIERNLAVDLGLKIFETDERVFGF